MRGNYMILPIIFLTGVVAASPSWAGCAARDLNGTYQFYSNWVEAGDLLDPMHNSRKGRRHR